MNKRNIKTRSRNYFYRGKGISITYSETVCVCSLVYPAYKAHVSYYFDVEACPTEPYFYTFFHERQDFSKKKKKIFKNLQQSSLAFVTATEIIIITIVISRWAEALQLDILCTRMKTTKLNNTSIKYLLSRYLKRAFLLLFLYPVTSRCRGLRFIC
jgi:hypothetical protein